MRGYDLVTLIFVREVNEPLTSLVKQLDEYLVQVAPAQPGQIKRGIFIVYLSDKPGLQQELTELVKREGLKQVVLAAHQAAAPPRYKVAPEASITVAVYDKRKVVANIALKAGELDAERACDILSAVRQVLPTR